MRTSTKSKWLLLGGYGLIGLAAIYLLYAIGVMLSSNAEQVLQLSAWSKFAVFKLMALRIGLYALIYWQIPSIFVRYKKKAANPEAVTIIRSTFVKLCVVYEVILGFSAL